MLSHYKQVRKLDTGETTRPTCDRETKAHLHRNAREAPVDGVQCSREGCMECADGVAAPTFPPKTWPGKLGTDPRTGTLKRVNRGQSTAKSWS